MKLFWTRQTSTWSHRPQWCKNNLFISSFFVWGNSDALSIIWHFVNKGYHLQHQHDTTTRHSSEGASSSSEYFINLPWCPPRCPIKGAKDSQYICALGALYDPGLLSPPYLNVIALPDPLSLLSLDGIGKKQSSAIMFCHSDQSHTCVYTHMIVINIDNLFASVQFLSLL